jgi:flagellar protein FlaG
MSEVKANPIVDIRLSGLTSSVTGGVFTSAVANAKSPLIETAIVGQTSKAEKPVLSEQKVGEAVAKMNDFVQAEQRNLHFSVDENSGVTVIKVVDKESGELIRQIPSEVFLDLAEKTHEDGSFHLISVQG